MDFRETVLLAALIMTSLGVASAQEAGSAAPKGAAPERKESQGDSVQDPLKIKLHLPKVEEGEVVRLFRKITTLTPAVSYEMLRNPEDTRPFRVKGFTLEEGDYAIGDILARIRAGTDAITWQTVGDHVYVRFHLSEEFPNPLDKEVKVGLKGVFTKDKIVAWLNDQVPEVHQMRFREDKVGGIPDSVREISIEPGLNVRTFLSRVGKAWGVGWGARVFSRPIELKIENPVTGVKTTVIDLRIAVAFGEGALPHEL
jgi:hypothetical protein